MNKLLIAMAAATLTLQPAGAMAADPEAARAHGQKLLQPFKKELMQTLREGLAQGPAAAVEKCHLVAPEIPGRVAPEGVKMGRTSHRLRNPDNRASAWQARHLEHYLENPGDRSSRVDSLTGKRLAYVEPIEVKPMCLTCHGEPEQIPAAVRKKLEEKYPDDNATGFETGDFRGIFWVTWPADQQPEKS